VRRWDTPSRLPCGGGMGDHPQHFIFDLPKLYSDQKFLAAMMRMASRKRAQLVLPSAQCLMMSSQRAQGIRTFKVLATCYRMPVFWKSEIRLLICCILVSSTLSNKGFIEPLPAPDDGTCGGVALGTMPILSPAGVDKCCTMRFARSQYSEACLMKPTRFHMTVCRTSWPAIGACRGL
jgi:hypothetical protein